MISFGVCLCECVGKKHGFYVCACICIYRYMYVSGVYIYVHLGEMCMLAYVHIYPVYLYMHTYVWSLEPHLHVALSEMTRSFMAPFLYRLSGIWQFEDPNYRLLSPDRLENIKTSLTNTVSLVQ